MIYGTQHAFYLRENHSRDRFHACMWPSLSLPTSFLTINDTCATPIISVLLQSICSIYMQTNETPEYSLEFMFVNLQNFISGDCHKNHAKIDIKNCLNET